MTVSAAVESCVVRAAGAAWRLADRYLLPRVPARPAGHAPPAMDGRPSPLTLGWPRHTRSLCPDCVRTARRQLLADPNGLERLRREPVGEVSARILERDGRVVIEKHCPRHGRVEDVLATNARFLERLERLSTGHDAASNANGLRDHGTSSIRYGRGAVLNIDLTNRCDMMCESCFMDANQAGYVHELTLDDTKHILDRAAEATPRRQLAVQFSGGEPTLSPVLLPAITHARRLGYAKVQVASNGVRFAQDPDFAVEAASAGLSLAYLQFDGVGNDANRHRKVGNLLEVKLRAIEHLHRAGIDVVLVATVAKGVNDDQVGPIVRFAIENADKLTFVVFQPITFAGRDEAVDDTARRAKRYTLADLAEDVCAQVGRLEPLRDWFPVSASTAISDLTDAVLGREGGWGTLRCGCHPHCGVVAAALVNTRTKAWSPLTEFLDLETLAGDASRVASLRRGATTTKVLALLALLRSYRPSRAPAGLRLFDVVAKFDHQSGGALGGTRRNRPDLAGRAHEWMVFFIGGMWFQDLWTYDFARTEMCIVPCGTQLGEISFCAYNSGVGWRQFVERRFQGGRVSKWYAANGRHHVYARPGEEVPLPPLTAPITVRVPGPDGRAPDSASARPPRTSGADG